MTISLCGEARFVSAVLCRPENEVRAKLGLPPIVKGGTCFACGKPLHYETHRKTGLCWDCYIQSHHVLVACDAPGCGKLIDRYVSRAIMSKHAFCNKSCQGRWLGIQYGIGRKKEVVE